MTARLSAESEKAVARSARQVDALTSEDIFMEARPFLRSLAFAVQEAERARVIAIVHKSGTSIAHQIARAIREQPDTEGEEP